MTIYLRLDTWILFFALVLCLAGNRVLSQKYSDNIPEAIFRIDAKDAGIVLNYGDRPESCEYISLGLI